MTEERAPYQRIADDLKDEITSGRLRPGWRVPASTELARRYGVTTNTANRALTLLAAQGLLIKKPGSGSYVRDPHPERRRITRGTHVHRRRTSGYSFSATRPDDPDWQPHFPPIYEDAPITERAAEILGLVPGTPVFRRRRMMSLPGEPPFNLSDSWIVPEVVQAAPAVRERGVPGGYLDAIEAAGHGPLSWYELTRARTPTIEEAELLGVDPLFPVMEICKVSVSASIGTPIEVTVMVIPSDRIEIFQELQRDHTAAYEVLSPPGGRADSATEA
ncbi:GntR family transcriptional regulator [Streptosporangium sp. NPDC000509]|uniref:GntR family transcriptional regulator n=1 Tax=Streptosporangium sp. NPDC000509 TaxID=3366186 RepID=UPI003686C2CB